MQALSIHNYKKDIEDPKKFINEVERVSEHVVSLDVSVFDIINEIDNKNVELQKLNSKILSARMKLKNIECGQEQVANGIKKFGVGKTLGDGDDTNT